MKVWALVTLVLVACGSSGASPQPQSDRVQELTEEVAHLRAALGPWDGSTSFWCPLQSPSVCFPQGAFIRGKSPEETAQIAVTAVRLAAQACWRPGEPCFATRLVTCSIPRNKLIPRLKFDASFSAVALCYATSSICESKLSRFPGEHCVEFFDGRPVTSPAQP